MSIASFLALNTTLTAGTNRTQVTDGTTNAAVKAASTAPVATDPALVVSISPNSALTATNPSVGTNAAAIPTSSTQVGGSDGTLLRQLATDPNGILYTATLGEAISRARVTSAFVGSIGGNVTTVAITKALITATAYTQQTSGAQRSMSSSSASDTSAGVGARTVRITYYTSSAGAISGPFTETITMNGTTPVNTVATNIWFVEKLEVLTVGSTGSPVGTISLFVTTAGGGGAFYSIAIGSNSTRSAHHYVASGRTCMLYGLSFQSDAAAAQNPVFSVEMTDPTSTNNAERIVIQAATAGQGAGSVVVSNIPIAVAGPARVRIYVTPTNTASQVTRAELRFVEI